MGKYIESDIQIRFADADSLGHINNVNLQHYFDVGKMEFYEKVLGKTIDPDAESLILVSIHTNYHRQSRLHSQLVVRTWVEKIGNSSVTIFQHLIDRADGGINADCRSVAVGYDFLRQESFPLKKEWRAKMEEYLRQEYCYWFTCMQISGLRPAEFHIEYELHPSKLYRP